MMQLEHNVLTAFLIGIHPNIPPSIFISLISESHQLHSIAKSNSNSSLISFQSTIRVFLLYKQYTQITQLNKSFDSLKVSLFLNYKQNEAESPFHMVYTFFRYWYRLDAIRAINYAKLYVVLVRLDCQPVHMNKTRSFIDRTIQQQYCVVHHRDHYSYSMSVRDKKRFSSGIADTNLNGMGGYKNYKWQNHKSVVLFLLWQAILNAFLAFY